MSAATKEVRVDLEVEKQRHGVTLDFSDVYKDNFQFVWRSLRGLGVPSEAVDDAAQDCFVIAHRRLDTCNGPEAARGWMYGIARRVAKDYRRSIARKGIHTELDENAPAPSEGAEEQLSRRRLIARVEKFADTLGERDRALFVLSEIHELTAREICDMLGLNLNTAYSRLRRMRSALMSALDQDEVGNDGPQ